MNRSIADAGHLPRAYQVLEVRLENSTTRTFVLDGSIEAVPGQFVMVWLPGLDEKPFSLSGADPIALTVERVGPFTTAMHALSAGHRLWLRGPFGTGFTLCQGTHLLIGGGCGTPPLLHLAEAARQCGHDVIVALGAKTREKLFFADRFAALGCAVHVATDDGSTGHHGTAIDVANRLLDEQRTLVSTLYACGPERMLEAAYETAQAHRLPCELSYEAYMRCGIGVCGSCARSGCLVCKDGPVLKQPPVFPSTDVCRCDALAG